MMLAFVAIVGIVGFVQMRTDKPLASHLPAPAHPLLKPEPNTLLSRNDLMLSARQRSAIQGIAASWSGDREKLLTAMAAYQPKPGRTDQISGSLQGYSELSRSYDVTRARYWLMASAQLDSRQRALLEGASK